MKHLYILIITFVFNSPLFTQYVPEWVQLHTQGNLSLISSSQTAMDNSGNIFAANYYFTNNNSDVITTKYNSDGTFSWSRQFNSSGNEDQDFPRKTLADPLGNVYVFGNASSNNYFDQKVFILKYNSEGVLISSVEYKRPGNPITVVSDAMIDPNGNIFVCGKVDSYQTFDDSALVAKFDPTLNLIWAKTNKDSTTSNNFAHTFKIDPFGNIFVTEVSWNSLINSKYDQSGNVIWSRKIYIPLLFFSQHSSMSFLDDNQNLYVSSNKNEVEGNDTSKTVLLKYNSSGILQWFNVYNISPSGTEIVRNLFSDNLNVYLDVSENDNISLAKFDQNGTLQWQKSMDHSVHYMNLDNSNRVITVGHKNTYNRTEMCMEKFNSAGTREVSYLYTYNGSGFDQAVTFFNTNDSKLVFGGFHNSSVMLLKLAPSQQNTVTITRSVSKPILDLQSTFDTISFSADLLPPDAYITDVNVTIDTILHPFVGDLEISLIHNQYKDTLVYRRGFSGDNFIGTVLDDTASSPICNSNAVPFTGFFKPCRPLSQFNSLLTEGPWILQIYDRKSSDTGELKAWTLTVTYNTLIGITQISNEIPSVFLLSQNYPNPFNPNTRIKFSVPKSSQIRLNVYDMLGKEVTTLVDNFLKAGTYETDFNASNLASGIYLYKLITEDYSETKKMILIK
jgi:subtilisin-like proprotein convertase family protein